MSDALAIESIEAIPIRAPLGRTFRGSTYHMTHRATVLVRLTTSSGVVGEAYAGDEDAALAAIVGVLESELAPRLVGQDCLAVERCWELAYPVTFDILRDRRIGLVALAAADLAVWDAVGKALGQPLWRLWGGYRDTVQMIVIGGYYDGEDPIEAEIAGYREMGLAGCKLKVGGAAPAIDAERVLAARAAGGDDFVLTIDANQGYTVAEAIELCRRLEGAGIRWFEEPCRWHNDRRDLRDVRAIGGIPVCAGQTETSVSGCRDLMEAGSIDVCNFDSSWSGGPTAWRRCAAVAHAYDVAMGHHEEPQVALHLIASQAHGTYAECFHPDRDPVWWGMVANRPEPVGGLVRLPAGPGLGWELDRDFIEFHRIDR
ncbi:MAG: mandelate racemase/muconate lactonizing enzyme family protein [Acidimicrobiales bacterium]